MTFANTEDFISFRQHVYRKGEGAKIELEELGPRFELKRNFLLKNFKCKKQFLYFCRFKQK